MFIHDAVLEAVVCGNTEVSATNMRKYVNSLQSSDTGNSFEKQFQVTCLCNGLAFSLFTYCSCLTIQVLQATSPVGNKRICRAGSQPGVQEKNRYQDIIPCWCSFYVLCRSSLATVVPYLQWTVRELFSTWKGVLVIVLIRTQLQYQTTSMRVSWM